MTERLDRAKELAQDGYAAQEVYEWDNPLTPPEWEFVKSKVLPRAKTRFVERFTDNGESYTVVFWHRAGSIQEEYNWSRWVVKGGETA